VSAPTTTAGRPSGLRDRERGDTLVLAALTSGELDGYEVARRLHDDAGRTPRPSAQQIFASLHRLQRNRLVRRAPRDPRRYHLTATGSRVLAARTAAADAYAAALHSLGGSAS
jgi:DNA-binding PadR family transcriptional regulator